MQAIVKEELTAVKTEFATPRKTVIVEQEGEVEDEDLIQREDMVVTVSHAGYIKRVPLSTYRAQRRGGKGRSGMATRDEDFVTQLFVTSTHTPVLFFSSRGMCYRMKVWRLPLGTPQSRGKALINLLPLAEGRRGSRGQGHEHQPAEDGADAVNQDKRLALSFDRECGANGRCHGDHLSGYFSFIMS